MNPLHFPKIALNISDYKNLLSNLDKAVFRVVKMNRANVSSKAQVIHIRGDR